MGTSTTQAAGQSSAGANRTNPETGGFSASATPSPDTSLPAAPAGVTFQPDKRAVSNWRAEAIENLGLPAEIKAKLQAGAGEPSVPRCVKLNNYWCIKRARWAGEIAADAEGHVAFATAIDGAIAAAMLLRRYYLEYKRRSALAILSRWAPPQCPGGVAAALIGRLQKPGAARFAALDGVAPYGIQNTLRARWLAAHRRGFPGLDKTTAPHRSIVPSRPLALMPAPEIAAGMGERRAPIRIAALELAPPVKEPLGGACAGARESYAASAIEGIAASPNVDLNLFAADGTPDAALPRLLANMAKVEIGPLPVRAGLIAAAIDRAIPRSRAAGPPAANTPGGGASSETPRQGL